MVVPSAQIWHQIYRGFIEAVNAQRPVIFTDDATVCDGIMTVTAVQFPPATTCIDSGQLEDDLFNDVDLIFAAGRLKVGRRLVGSLSSINLLIPMKDWKAALNASALQLDSRLYLYDWSNKDKNAAKLYEAYGTLGGHIRVTSIGTWNQTLGVTFKEQNFWERRSDLGGVPLRCAVKPYSVLNTVDGSGYMEDLLIQLKRAANFTVRMVASPDGHWGGLEADGKTWNGLVGMAARSDVDLVYSTMTRKACWFSVDPN